jgi:hypothetical protein
MKKNLLLICVVVVVVLTSFTRHLGDEPNAVVEKKFGVDIYTFCRPTREYEVIKRGTDFKPLSFSCAALVNNAAKQGMNLKADAVIVHLEGYSFEAIKYK